MTIQSPLISDHAAQRMAQRNLKTNDIAFVLRYGRCIHRTGAKFYFLGRRDIPEGMERAIEPLVGTTVIVEDEQITTIYRNRRALAKIKRKLSRRSGGETRRHGDTGTRGREEESPRRGIASLG